MSYIHPTWHYGQHSSGLPMEHSYNYEPSMMPPPMMHHHSTDGYLYPHPPMEMIDYYHQPIMDYDEYTENLSRPRLTKEQVETLESQFQAHPKPSSNVKRQLAAQTNLSLPRVANWFQNRRAKAKQQKRQEEFETMQKAKVEAEEASRRKSETLDQLESRQSSSTVKEEPERSPTPKQQPATSTSESATSTHASTSASRKHQKTKSDTAREATFASLQRALNAAVAARERFSHQDSLGQHQTPCEEESVSPTSMAPPKAIQCTQETKVLPYHSSYHDWPGMKEDSHSWASAHGHADTSLSPASQTMVASRSSHSAHQNVDSYSGAQYAPRSEQQMGLIGSDTGLGYSNMQYPMSMPEISVNRRESSCTLTASLEGIGISTGSPPTSQAEGSWKESGKELDLAARRKRPRPAAIGTANTPTLSASTSMTSLSPSRRMSNSGAGNSMRHTKSAQCLSSRYAGVRKVSATQRSPLNFTFAEAVSMKPSKADMLRTSVSSSSLVPPTPLTPQDFQHLVPASPTESNYCLPAQSNNQFYPPSHSMQVNIASPPATPMDIYSPFPYQNVGPPISAPAHLSCFPEYVGCDQTRSWADNASNSSPEFHSSMQVTHPSTVSPIPYDSVEHHGQGYAMESVSASPSLIYSIEDADMAVSDGERKVSDYMMHEYHEQQETNHFGHLQSAHKPKAYTFANNATLSNFP
ncbi:hypothetical protein N7495_005672 [Penicillium taxi]|uniref:uncharacterized protein n=1 Tax=Penicillium taxi TaxID=168475 RepID=UPI002544F6CD|nr:uncharacterized protein N7495_005672 [Penicillium taxi]KAJ5893981.1 hypothetical protein N7495_005672 [Penicillium taxi]